MLAVCEGRHQDPQHLCGPLIKQIALELVMEKASEIIEIFSHLCADYFCLIPLFRLFFFFFGQGNANDNIPRAGLADEKEHEV